MQAVVYINKKYLGMVFEIVKIEPVKDNEKAIAITLNQQENATIYLKNATVIDVRL